MRDFEVNSLSIAKQCRHLQLSRDYSEKTAGKYCHEVFCFENENASLFSKVIDLSDI